MTDLAIFRGGLRAIGQPDDLSAALRLIEPYLAILRDEVGAAEDYRLHQGIREILDALEPRPGVHLGLGTGNLEAGARIKLERLGIAQRFAFGGFGSDHELRAQLLRVGVERGARLAGRRPEECRVLVVGDTPRDIEAARKIGAQCVAVATGPYDRAALSLHGPEEVVARVLDSRLLADLAGS
jgi:phosphoglycolate phosphatase-like HAD superfamily hydrolase